MTAGMIFWLVTFVLAAVLFFGVAIFIGIRGVGDLRRLLSASHKDGDSRPR
jgi:hypothetical protein